MAHFTKDDLPSKGTCLRMGAIFSCIVIISFLLCMSADVLLSRPNLKLYIEKACDEGVSVYLWNIVVSLGILLWGLLVLFPGNIIAKITITTLSNANSIGAVMFGILAGQAFRGVSALSSDSWVKVWGLGVGWMILAGVLLCFLAFIWIASYLPRQDGFLEKVRLTPLSIRVPIALVNFMPLLWAYCEG